MPRRRKRLRYNTPFDEYADGRISYDEYKEATALERAARERKMDDASMRVEKHNPAEFPTSCPRCSPCNHANRKFCLCRPGIWFCLDCDYDTHIIPRGCPTCQEERAKVWTPNTFFLGPEQDTNSRRMR